MIGPPRVARDGRRVDRCAGATRERDKAVLERLRPHGCRSRGRCASAVGDRHRARAAEPAGHPREPCCRPGRVVTPSAPRIGQGACPGRLPSIDQGSRRHASGIGARGRLLRKKDGSERRGGARSRRSGGNHDRCRPRVVPIRPQRHRVKRHDVHAERAPTSTRRHLQNSLHRHEALRQTRRSPPLMLGGLVAPLVVDGRDAEAQALARARRHVDAIRAGGTGGRVVARSQLRRPGEEVRAAGKHDARTREEHHSEHGQQTTALHRYIVTHHKTSVNAWWLRVGVPLHGRAWAPRQATRAHRGPSPRDASCRSRPARSAPTRSPPDPDRRCART